jgi:phospholipid/cholesterol/gamma-HCH transport system substrate-binding protein
LKVRNEIKVGVLILITLGLIYFGLNYLKGKDVFGKTISYYSVYDRIDGLTRDNPIMLNGAKIGRVSDVTLMPNKGNKILVKMEIQLEGLLVPDSTKAVIVDQDLLGSKEVNFEFPEVMTFDNPSDTLIPGIEKELGQVVEEALAPIQAKIERLVEETQDLVAHVQITVTTINETVKTAEAAIGSIKHATESIDTMVTNQSAKLSRVLDNVGAITANLRSNSENINDILQNVAIISDSLTRANYATAIQNASSALAQFDSLITSINNGQGSLGLLVTDDQLYRNLEQAALEIDMLTEDIRRQPKRYLSPLGKKNKNPEPKKNRDANGRVIEVDTTTN